MKTTRVTDRAHSVLVRSPRLLNNLVELGVREEDLARAGVDEALLRKHFRGSVVRKMSRLQSLHVAPDEDAKPAAKSVSPGSQAKAGAVASSPGPQAGVEQQPRPKGPSFRAWAAPLAAV